MTLVLKDRVRDTTTTVGTGTVTLSGTAPTGFQNFSAIGNGNSTYYTIAAGTEWEVGIGTYSSTGPTLSRDTVLESSNAGALVPFSAGAKDVFVTYPAENAISDGYGTLPVANGGTGVNTSTGTGSTVLNTAPTFADVGMNNTNISAIKTATFNSQTTIATTSGSITVDWTTAQNQKQTEPTGTITYTFTAPAGPCHLQLLIDSDGTSTAQTINWPGTVIWLNTTWAGINNKKAVINFWYDGTSYYAIGSNQV